MKPKMDRRLLTPGWAGELAPDEFEFVHTTLLKNKKLSYAWGFRPGMKSRYEWSIRQVARWGDPDSRSTNYRLARLQIT